MKKLILLSLIGLVSCMEPKPECTNPQPGKLVLIGYKVHKKHSRIYLKNPDNNEKYQLSTGRRREPIINLGDTINVQYCNGELIFDRYQYVKSATNRSTRTEILKNETID